MNLETASLPSLGLPQKHRSQMTYGYIPETTNSTNRNAVSFRSSSTPVVPARKQVQPNPRRKPFIGQKDGLVLGLLAVGVACLISGFAISIFVGLTGAGILFPIGATFVFLASLVAGHNRRGHPSGGKLTG